MEQVLVLGASLNPGRYSNMAMLKLKQYQYLVYGLGIEKGEVDGMEIQTQPIKINNLYAVTVYLKPSNQKSYYDYITALQPGKVIFNPGAENREFELLLTSHGIPYERACTLVLLSLGKF